jgi:hypothetical protein
VNVGAAYDFGSFNVRSTYSHGPTGRPLLLGAGGSSGNFRASLLAGYDFQQQAAAVELDASYQFTGDFASFITLAHAEDEFSVRAGASVRFRGGFATPEGVVSVFGGRQVGWIEGVLFHDLNANGQPDAGEQRLVGVTVSAGNTSAETGSEGRFRLALPAGEHRITISNISAGLALITPVAVSVSVNETNIIDLPLRAVTGLTGTVIKTADRTADSQAGTPLPYSRITLEREDGQLFTARADDRGRFFFQNLEPGHYTIMLDPASLPEFHMVTSPPQELDLQPGPLRRIDLTAAEQEKTVIPTFLPGDLALTARTEPASAPAGADIRVIASVQGEAQKVFVRFAGTEVPLELQEPGQYAAMITLPSEPGVANLEVIATDSRKEVQRSLTLVLQPGSLGRLHVQPPYLEAGEEARLTAEFLTRVDEAFVLFDGERIGLTREGPYTFSGQLQAPAEPGSYQLELEADGETFSTARFRVAD